MPVIQIEDAHRFLEIHFEKIILDSTSTFAPSIWKVKMNVWKKKKEKNAYFRQPCIQNQIIRVSNIHIFFSYFLPPRMPGLIIRLLTIIDWKWSRSSKMILGRINVSPLTTANQVISFSNLKSLSLSLSFSLSLSLNIYIYIYIYIYILSLDILVFFFCLRLLLSVSDCSHLSIYVAIYLSIHLSYSVHIQLAVV